MNPIRELKRLASPVAKPQALAWDGATLWLSSRDEKTIHGLDPVRWVSTWSVAAPGTPWGMTAVNGSLAVLCGETEADTRIIRRCVPGRGFVPDYGLPCPEDLGSHLSYDGQSLILSQWYPKKLLFLDPLGQPTRVLLSPRGICGHCRAKDVFYLVTTDAEETNEYYLTRIDPRPAVPVVTDVATIPFPARALAFDGNNFWTNHRAADQTVCFAPPAGA